MKAVILAAGRGKRLEPLTLDIPKAMIPINDKPLLEIIIGQLKSVGVTEIVIVVHYLKQKITEYFGDGSQFGVIIHYVEQQEMRGTADAVLQAEAHIEDRFICIAADSLFETELLGKLVASEADGVISCREVEDTRPWGILRVEGNKVLEIVEKPDIPPSHLANFSLYLFPKEIFVACGQVQPSARGELEINDAIKMLIDKGKYFTYVASGYILDIGTHEQLEEAKELAKKLGL